MTLSEISRTVEEINTSINERKVRLAPQIKKLRTVRAQFAVGRCGCLVHHFIVHFVQASMGAACTGSVPLILCGDRPVVSSFVPYLNFLCLYQHTVWLLVDKTHVHHCLDLGFLCLYQCTADAYWLNKHTLSDIRSWRRSTGRRRAGMTRPWRLTTHACLLWSRRCVCVGGGGVT